MSELIWDGKYDKAGHKTAPLRVALPFQTVETVNESSKERQRSLDLFTTGGHAGWRNCLVWGDKKYVLPALLGEFSGKVDLIYIDPPFASGQDFSFRVSMPDAEFVKAPSAIEMKAYRDTWGAGLDSYFQWFYETAILLHELLSPTGSLYVHLDSHVGANAKMILDEVFGRDHFQNEIIWQRTSAHSDTHRYGVNYDVIFFYSKGDRFTWNVGYHKYSDKQLARYRSEDGGRKFADFDLTQAGLRRGSSGQPWKGYDPGSKGNHWKFDVPTLEVMEAEGRIYWPKTGGFPRMKRYAEEAKGVPLQSVWTDIFPVNSQAEERVGYDTQKPLALLERIIGASTNESDLVLDCFVGSGTTAVAAEKLRRRWVVADLGRFAVHTTRKRLLSIAEVAPFVIQNLGKYERQLWQATEFGQSAQARTAAYRQFILKLYKADPIEGYMWLHGLKQGRLVHVGTVDAPVTAGDVKQISTDFKRVMGTGEQAPSVKAVDVLGWDFAFEVNELARQAAGLAGIDMRFVHIPREVLDKRAVEQGDVRFFELAALKADLHQRGRSVSVTLTNFVIPPDDVPDDIQRKIKDWSQWIDYWAVDWENKGDAFHNEWQSYRTRKGPELGRIAKHDYPGSGTYKVVVKVIDILGNDTTKTFQIDIP